MMLEEFKGRRVVTVPEAGRVLGLSRNKSYQAVADGELPALKFGRRLVVSVAVLERLLETGQDKAA